MFIVELTYQKAIEQIDQYLKTHREFLDEGYQKNYFIVSGPQNPRVGGIIMSQLTKREQLEEILQQDPFYIHGLATYRIIEFEPIKCHKNFKYFVDNNLS